MLTQPTDIQSIQRQFQEVRALLVSITSSVARMGGPEATNVIRDISRITQSLVNLEQSVLDYLKVRQSQAWGVDGDWECDQLIPGQEAGARGGHG